MTNSFGLVIEGMVSLLLLLTIGYCFVLNSKLRRLKADELALKATIAELITVTEIAERAIAGLKVTVRECDQTIGERLRTAERFSADIALQIEEGSELVDRLTRIVSAGRPQQVSAPAPLAVPPQRGPGANDSHALLAAARVFAERSRARVNGVAA